MTHIAESQPGTNRREEHPNDSRARRPIFLVASGVLCVFGILGIPMLPLPKRGTAEEDVLEAFERSSAAWVAFDGWRYSVWCWMCLAAAIGFLIAALVRVRPTPYKKFQQTWLIGGPVIGTLSAGIAIHVLAGLPASNYETIAGMEDFNSYAWVIPALGVFVLGLTLLIEAISAAVISRNLKAAPIRKSALRRAQRDD